MYVCRYLLCNKTSIVNLTRTQSIVEQVEKESTQPIEENESEPELEKGKENGDEMKDLIFSPTTDIQEKEPEVDPSVVEQDNLAQIDEEIAKSATEVIF